MLSDTERKICSKSDLPGSLTYVLYDNIIIIVFAMHETNNTIQKS